MRVLKTLPGYSSKVEIVSFRGKKYVRKTMSMEEVWNEKAFIETLKQHGIPAISYHRNAFLENNQLLLTYVKDSPTMGSQMKPYLFYQWGKVLHRMHKITFPYCYRITENGVETPLNWEQFLEHHILHPKRESDLPTTLVRDIQTILRRILTKETVRFSLLHGDPHPNNVMILNNSVTFFDKSSEVFCGNKFYDLGLIALSFARALYHYDNSFQEETREREYLKAFLEGYGATLRQDCGEELDLYVLLRAFLRYPNPYEPELKGLILALRERLA